MGEVAEADDGAARLAADEEDAPRQGEHVVQRSPIGVVVCIDALDPHTRGQRGEHRLELLARLAPRRPELEEHPGAHRAVNRSSGTFSIASRTIERLIFEVPSVRSTKTMGISSTRKPFRM